jgi:WD40 repeat protein
MRRDKSTGTSMSMTAFSLTMESKIAHSVRSKITAVSYHPDEKSMSYQHSLQIAWQGQLSDYITALAWSPTAPCWAASSAAGEVVCWADQELIYLQSAHEYSIDCLGYAADGQFLAAGGQQGKLQIWSEQQLITTLDYPRTWIDHLAWHPTQPLLAFSTGKQVQLWDAAQKKIVTTLNFDRSSVSALAWQPQGDYLAVAGYQGVEVWQWLSDESERLVVDTSVHAVAWSGDGQYLAAATLDRQLSIARLGELEMPWVMRGFPGKIQQLAWLFDALAVLSGEQLVWWHYADEDWQALSTDHPNITKLAIHPQLSLVSMVNTKGILTLSTAELQTVAEFNWSSGRCTALAWSTTGQYLASSSDRGDLLLLDSDWGIMLATAGINTL